MWKDGPWRPRHLSTWMRLFASTTGTQKDLGQLGACHDAAGDAGGEQGYLASRRLTWLASQPALSRSITSWHQRTPEALWEGPKRQSTPRLIVHKWRHLGWRCFGAGVVQWDPSFHHHWWMFSRQKPMEMSRIKRMMMRILILISAY